MYHTVLVTSHDAMPAIDFKALFNEERERRRLQKKQQSESSGGLEGGPGVATNDTTRVPTPMPSCDLAPRKKIHLPDYEVGKRFGVHGLHYIPDFITEQEEQAILRGVYAVGYTMLRAAVDVTLFRVSTALQLPHAARPLLLFLLFSRTRKKKQRCLRLPSNPYSMIPHSFLIILRLSYYCVFYHDSSRGVLVGTTLLRGRHGGTVGTMRKATGAKLGWEARRRQSHRRFASVRRIARERRHGCGDLRRNKRGRVTRLERRTRHIVYEDKDMYDMKIHDPPFLFSSFVCSSSYLLRQPRSRDVSEGEGVNGERERERGKRPCAPPNHVLVNEYNRPAGISPHNDGALYAPHVAIVTLSGSALMDFWPIEGPAIEVEEEKEDLQPRSSPPPPKPVTQVMLQPRSLLLYRQDAYALRHGIRESAVDRISERCANTDDEIVSGPGAGPNGKGACVKVGDEVVRGEKRLSVVFVRKGLQH